MNILSCYAESETPVRWKQLTACCPQEHRPQTAQNQKIDADSRLPHHQSVRWMSVSCSHPHNLPPSPSLETFPWKPLGSSSRWALAAWTACLPRLLLLRVRLYATPETAAHQAPPSLGFSRREHWSGLPFPSPVHEREKPKWSCSVVSDS